MFSGGTDQLLLAYTIHTSMALARFASPLHFLVPSSSIKPVANARYNTRHPNKTGTGGTASTQARTNIATNPPSTTYCVVGQAMKASNHHDAELSSPFSPIRHVRGEEGEEEEEESHDTTLTPPYGRESNRVCCNLNPAAGLADGGDRLPSGPPLPPTTDGRHCHSATPQPSKRAPQLRST